MSRARQAIPEFSTGAQELVEAIRIGDTESRNALLLVDVSPNTRDSDGNPALMLTVGNSDHSLCRRLLERGADPYYEVTGLRRIFVAANRGHLDTVRLLIEFGPT
jgi:ankyrin repeat protein